MKQLFSLQKIPVSLFILFLCFRAEAGDPVFRLTGAREAGMGCIMSTANPFWSIFHNQGLLAGNECITAGICYENRFFLSELATRSAAVFVPAGKASLAALYSYFGYSDYHRQMTAIACGLPLSEKVSAGIQIDYFNERSYGEYSALQSLTFEAGMIISTGGDFDLGIQIFNPLPNSIRKKDLPTELRLDLCGYLNATVYTGAGIEMSTGGKPIFSAGMEYEVMKSLWLRGGFRSENTSFSFGMGYRIKTAVIDLAFYTHEKLGLSSTISVIYKIIRSK